MIANQVQFQFFAICLWRSFRREKTFRGTKSTDYRPFLALSLFHKEKYMIAAIQSVLVSMIVVIIQLSPFANIARMLT